MCLCTHKLFKFWDKDALAFSAKRVKNFGTQFLVLLEI